MLAGSLGALCPGVLPRLAPPAHTPASRRWRHPARHPPRCPALLAGHQIRKANSISWLRHAPTAGAHAAGAPALPVSSTRSNRHPGAKSGGHVCVWTRSANRLRRHLNSTWAFLLLSLSIRPLHRPRRLQCAAWSRGQTGRWAGGGCIGGRAGFATLKTVKVFFDSSPWVSGRFAARPCTAVTVLSPVCS